MIRLMGMVNLRPLTEEIPEDADAEANAVELPAREDPDTSPDKKAQIGMVLKKLRESGKLTPDQYEKVCSMQETLDPSAAAITEAIPNNDMPQDEEDPEQPSAERGSAMAKADLLSLHKKAGELFNMFGEDEQLEGWVQEKISLSSEYINSVHGHMQYEKNKTAKVGEGDGSPADNPMGMSPADNGYATNESVADTWGAIIERVKKIQETDSTFSISEWMKKKGYQPVEIV